MLPLLTLQRLDGLQLTFIDDPSFMGEYEVDDYLCITTNGQLINKLRAVYAILQRQGWSFLHFLQADHPVVKQRVGGWYQKMPLLPVRRWHIHTQHPLELTNLLQGEDAEVPWELMLPELESMCEWLVANGQESLEYALLTSKLPLHLRTDRLKTIVDVCHRWGIRIGVDVPVALKQQHSYRLIKNYFDKLNLSQYENMFRNVQWLLNSIGFDFLSTEIGTSEFTKAADMLDLLNYLAKLHPVDVKIHVSQGMKFTQADGTEENYNFLPSEASSNVGLMCHTIQVPSLTDPVMTYGNDDFGFMLDYMFEPRNKDRIKLWYPETSYWVNYDVDVPLFLPLYALNRFRDLRLVLQRSMDTGIPFQGQVVFESGFEWCYWMQNVVTARCAYDDELLTMPEQQGFKQLLQVLCKPFGEFQGQYVDVLYQICLLQDKVLLRPDASNVLPIAYIIGRDVWSDFGNMFKHLLATMPRRPSFNKVKWAPWYSYVKKVKPTLDRLVDCFVQIEALWNSLPVVECVYYSEIKDTISLTLLRCLQIRELYASCHADKISHLVQARLYMQEAQCIREAVVFRSSLDRVAGWNAIPQTTSYRYGYLWTSVSGYYMTRDYLQAEGASFSAMFNPFFMNIIDPVDVTTGRKVLT